MNILREPTQAVNSKKSRRDFRIELLNNEELRWLTLQAMG